MVPCGSISATTLHWKFFQVDAMAHRSSDFTPYHYAGNNPIIGNDPTGLDVDYSTSWENPDYRFQKEQDSEGRRMAADNSSFFEDGGPTEETIVVRHRPLTLMGMQQK
jgi:hypothetical protein